VRRRVVLKGNLHDQLVRASLLLVLPRAATYDMVAVYSEGRRARSSESDIGKPRIRRISGTSE
jgi:hypothetical protein